MDGYVEFTCEELRERLERARVGSREFLEYEKDERAKTLKRSWWRRGRVSTVLELETDHLKRIRTIFDLECAIMGLGGRVLIGIDQAGWLQLLALRQWQG